MSQLTTKISNYAATVEIEIPSLKITMQDAVDALRGIETETTPESFKKFEKAFKSGMKCKDYQTLYEYHESEMLRHTEIVEKLKSKVSGKSA